MEAPALSKQVLQHTSKVQPLIFADLEEVRGHVGGHGPGQQRLAGARRAVEEDALRNLKCGKCA